MFEPTKQAIVREYKAEKREIRKISKQVKRSFSDILKEAQHNLINSNVKGRIFFKSRSGEYVATNVSPYSKDFEKNIEPKIKNIVISLRSKGYLTLSSCQGHGLGSKRYITMAFYSEERAKEFVKEINIPKFNYIFSKPENYMNTSYVIENNKIVDVKRNSAPDEKACIFSLNCLFERKYQNYTLLEIQISADGMSLRKLFYKVFLLGYFTKLFEKRILNIRNYEM